MPTLNENVDAIAYLTIEGTRSRFGDKSVRSAKAVRVTQNRPTSLTGDQVAIRITVRLPIAAFEPLQPEALVVVPEELVQHTVEAEAS